MLVRNTNRPSRAERRAQKAIDMGHDDLAQYVTHPELLALLEPYRFTFACVGIAGGPSDLWLGFGRFTVEKVARVFADPLGRRALIRLLDAYRTIGFSLRVWEASHFEGWGYDVQGEHGELLAHHPAASEIGAWAAAAYIVHGTLLKEHLPGVAGEESEYKKGSGI